MSSMDPPAAVEDVHAYCREVETYLCRRNDGHLIRLVGPAFELVRGWAERGIPFAVVREGIDRVVERGERRLTRRRPVRIEFCEGDVLDGYDRWRRAVGVAAVAGGEPSPSRRSSLHTHVERVAMQLASALERERVPASLRPAVTDALTGLEVVSPDSGTARGAARDALLVRLADIDRALLEAAEAAMPADRLSTFTLEAEGELAVFRPRLTAEAWQAAVAAARGRLVRAAFGLPVVSFE